MTAINEIAPDLFRLSMPYTRQTEDILRSLAGLKPQTLAVRHGSLYRGQGERLLTGLAGVIRENFDQAAPCAAPDSDPATPVGNSVVTERPPTVS